MGREDKGNDKLQKGYPGDGVRSTSGWCRGLLWRERTVGRLRHAFTALWNGAGRGPDPLEENTPWRTLVCCILWWWCAVTAVLIGFALLGVALAAVAPQMVVFAYIAHICSLLFQAAGFALGAVYTVCSFAISPVKIHAAIDGNGVGFE